MGPAASTVPGSWSRPASSGAPASEDAPLVFPRAWLRAGVAWWALTAIGTVAVVAAVPSSLPYLAKVVIAGAPSVVPGLALSRLLVRRSYPALRGLWWRWYYALRCFFVFGYLAAFVLITRWLELRPPGAPAWSWALWLTVAFGAGGAVLGALSVRDTRRNGLGGRDRSEVVLDLAMVAVVELGPVALVVNRIHRVPLHDVLGMLAVLRPLSAAFGIAAGVLWSACLTRLLTETAGLRALSVDGVDLVAAVVALGAPPLLAVAPAIGAHGPVLWQTVPMAILATALPGMVCGGAVLLARVPQRIRRSTGVWIVVLLVVSTVEAWCQLAMVLSGDRLPGVAMMLPAVCTFGLFLWLPLSERRLPVLGRGQPGEVPIRQWDAVPAVVGLGAAALVAEFLVGPGVRSADGLAAASVLGVLVLLGAVRHYATIGEARRLHRRIRSMTDELYQQSRVDPLTGLFNRRALVERFPQLAASCARASRPLSVAMVDLDHFKAFNDEHGHLAGDQLLRELAGTLLGVLRHEDVAARYGGEEFCLVLPGADPPQVAGLLDRLRDARAARAGVTGAGAAGDGAAGDGAAGPGSVGAGVGGLRAGFATFSAGVAGWRPGEAFDDVVRRADAACYAAKATGRDRVVLDAAEAARVPQGT